MVYSMHTSTRKLEVAGRNRREMQVFIASAVSIRLLVIQMESISPIEQQLQRI